MLLPKELSVLKESYLFLGCAGSLLLCIFLSSCGPQGLREWVSHGDVFSCLGARALGCADCTSWGTWAPRPWSTGSTAVVPGSAATRHVGLSRTRDWTYVSFIGRWILYRSASRVVQELSSKQTQACSFSSWDSYMAHSQQDQESVWKTRPFLSWALPGLLPLSPVCQFLGHISWWVTCNLLDVSCLP